MTRQECAAMVLGGPTTVLDVGGCALSATPRSTRLRLTGHGTWIPLR
jgi:hypothetical protein